MKRIFHTFGRLFGTVNAYCAKLNRPLKLEESIIDFMGYQNKDECKIRILQNENKIYVNSENKEAVEFSMGRPNYCPFAKKNQIPAIDWSSNSGPIDVACSVLIENSSSKFDGLLLTKRSTKLRTFPGLWVPPGGHIDPKEDLFEAAKREVIEEIGCGFNKTVDNFPYFDSGIKPLCAWESAYPTFISKRHPRPPKRHHLVLYFTAKFSQETENNFADFPLIPLKLHENEVVAAAWISRSQIESLVEDMRKCESLIREASIDNRVVYREDIYNLVGGKEENYTQIVALENFKACLDYPQKDLDQKLGSMKIWDTTSYKWEDYRFSEVCNGLLSGYRNSENASIKTLSPSRFSIGTLYAMRKWLEKTANS